MAQTFTIGNPDLEQTAGIQMTSMDLFFASKDPSLGVTIEIRKTVNGVPAPDLITFGRKHLTASQVNTSTDGSTATVVVFDGPVFLSTTEEYCFAIIPDGNSPDYQVWLSKTGGSDVATSQPVYSDQFNGSMFMSTNNRAWVPMIDEDIKFTLYRAGFSTDNANAGVVTFFNKANEYLSLTDINGNFKQGEMVFQVNATAQTTGTATMSTSNSVTNSTQIILKGYPLIANTTGIAVSKTPTGVVYYYDSSDRDMHIEDSTASSATFKFAAAASIVGAESGANATIGSIDNKTVYYKCLCCG